MNFPESMSIEEAFAKAEAEARLAAALKESEARFATAELPNRLNEDWRFGRPHKYATALAELLQSDTLSQGNCAVQHAGEAAVPVSSEDDDLRQTEMLMPTIGSDALLGMHLKRFGSGYALYIEEDTREPIRIEYSTSGLFTPSTFIMVAPGVKAEVVEIHQGSGDNASMFATRNIQIAEGAKLKIMLHSASMERYMCITNIQNMGGQVIQLTRHDSHSWAREETVAEIYAPESDIQLYSANEPRNSVLDQHTSQIHHVGGATSNLLYKNVLDGNATATFAGNIYVAPGAHNTDAYQSNRNLLLSEDATVNSLPGLEILADKVRCSHGSASAPVNEEQLFYLLSRGISRENAISLLSHGFIKDAIEKYEQS